jgi:hypothetical protein
MKYAVAYRTDKDNWVFLKFLPSKDFPFGMFGCGMAKFDDFESADAVRVDIVARNHSSQMGWPFVPDEEMSAWTASLRVVELPDAALAKFDEARRMTDECLAHPSDNVPAGSRENQLFHRGREIGEVGRQGWAILMEHLLRTSM